MLGGDDVSVLVAGRYALVFAVEFLRAFEKLSRKDGVLRHIQVPREPRGSGTPAERVTGGATGRDAGHGTARGAGRDAGHDTDGDTDHDAGHGVGLTAAAGVALVKWQFPFSQAYRLAEQLCSSAKERGRDRSYVDWHILYETNVPDLDHIRARLDLPPTTTTKTRLTCRPAMVSGSEQDDPDRHWERVLRRAAELTRKDQTGARLISRSHVIALRGQLTAPNEAEKLWAKISSPLPAAERATLGGGGNSSLFWPTAVDHPEQSPPDAEGTDSAEGPDRAEGSGGAEAAATTKTVRVTGLLDALELVDVLPASLLEKNRSENANA